MIATRPGDLVGVRSMRHTGRTAGLVLSVMCLLVCCSTVHIDPPFEWFTSAQDIIDAIVVCYTTSGDLPTEDEGFVHWLFRRGKGRDWFDQRGGTIRGDIGRPGARFLLLHTEIEFILRRHPQGTRFWLEWESHQIRYVREHFLASKDGQADAVRLSTADLPYVYWHPIRGVAVNTEAMKARKPVDLRTGVPVD